MTTFLFSILFSVSFVDGTSFFFCRVVDLPSGGNIFHVNSSTMSELRPLLAGGVSTFFGNKGLMPGDQIHLSAGEYNFSEPFLVNIRGNQTQPIVVRGYLNDRVVLRMTNSSANLFDVNNDLNFTYWYCNIFLSIALR